ncbi:hypothetical protein [Paludisphaera sp.]|uniref:phage tail tube protein n=1 Tax=Paludisphaera sp. TaxID=2017432 RepID=UPI00301DDACB
MAYITAGVGLGVNKAGTGTTYAPIDGVTNIQPPQESAAEVETTNYASARAESRPGLADSGSATIDIDFDPADEDHLYLQSIVGVTKPWRITVPGEQDLTIDFDGYITGWNPNLNARGAKATSQFVIRVTGLVVYDLAPAA